MQETGQCPHLSLVIPAYNEGKIVGNTIRQVTSYLESLGLSFEVIVVDDGSRDETSEVVCSLREEDNRVRLIANGRNRGKGFAVRRGVLASSGKIVMFTDADLSIPISLVPEFLQAIEVEGYDIAVASRWIEGSRWGEPLPLHRRAMGRGFRALVRLILNSGVQDTQCGSKAYRAGAAKLLFDRQRIDSFTFDAEVLFLARKMGLRVKEVPFELRPSHSSTVNPLVDPLRMLKDLIRVRIDYWRGLYR
jgi:dolichyl-phosphate beta-glucosyltransferase